MTDDTQANLTLTLVRHAKSCWDNPQLTDYRRPLNARGQNDLSGIAQRFAQQLALIAPMRILSSGATRTQITAKALHAALPTAPELVIDDGLYEATPETLLRIVQGQSMEYRHIVLVGHNPGLESLLTRVTGETLTKFPTGAIASMSLHVPEWRWLSSDKATLDWFDTPKQHRNNNQPQPNES
jgi:phosphohistidine phosphatase